MFSERQRGRGPLYKLAILGEGGVGKTALTIQLCLNQFVETYDPTIEDSYRKKVMLDGEPVTLEILDTAGQEEYTALRDQWIRDGEGFLLVYSITSRSTFTRIRQYYDQVVRVKDGEKFAMVLVANKCDRYSERSVSTSEGKQLAKDLGVLFFETSAKLNINTEDSFTQCARLTRDIRREQEEEENTEHLPPPDASPKLLHKPDGAPTQKVQSQKSGVASSVASAAGESSLNSSSQGRQTPNSGEAKKNKKDKKKKKCIVM